ncbi:MAG: MFS transporter [Planctomycetota bacterium]
MSGSRKSVLGVVFLTVFLDMVGFSVIFPLFPAMLEHYVGVEGETGLVAQLRDWLGTLASDDWAVLVLFGGLLGSLYSLLQFLFAPLWGELSDRHGRRPILLITLAGTACSYVLWTFAGTFLTLVLARLVGGIMAGNISTASAAIADTHSGRERAKGMGIMGAGIGLGFVVGPALGGMVSHFTKDLGLSGWGLNPFSVCAMVSFALAMLNLIWAYRKFPETLPAERREGSAGSRTFNPFRALKRLDHPGVVRATLAHFLFFTTFGAMEFTLTFLAVERLGFDELRNAWMFVFVGFAIAFVQGGVVRKLVPKHGERKLAILGMALTLPGFLFVGWAQSVGVLYLGLGLLAVGSAFVMPTLSALVSRYVPADRQGLAMGVFRSMGSLARAIGPIMGGILYWKLGSWGPYVVGAAIALVPLYLAVGLPAPPLEPPVEPPVEHGSKPALV